MGESTPVETLATTAGRRLASAVNALLMYLLFRFWRQLVFALVVDIAARLWLSDSTAVNVLVFAGAFAFAEGAHLLDARRRAREGLPPPSRRMLVATTAAL